MEKQIPQLLFGVANPFDWRSSVVPVFLLVNHDAAEGLALCWKVATHWSSGSCGRKQGLTTQCRWILHHLTGLLARIPHLLAVDLFFFCHDCLLLKWYPCFSLSNVKHQVFYEVSGTCSIVVLVLEAKILMVYDTVKPKALDVLS